MASVGFTPDGARRVGRAVRLVEQGHVSQTTPQVPYAARSIDQFWVRCTGSMTGGYYNGKRLDYDTATATFTDAQDILIHEVTGTTPIVDRKYLGTRHGSIDGVPVYTISAAGGTGGYVTIGGELSVGCGLTVVDDILLVNSLDLAGDGLEASGSCGLAVATTCGLQITDDRVGVDNVAIAGAGLVASTVDCEIAVAPGCGVFINGDGETAFFAPDVAGAGLEAVGDCELAVATTCGLQITGGRVGIDNTAVAGAGLTSTTVCGEIAVAPGCGIFINGDGETAFFAPDVAGAGLDAVDDCELAVDVTPASTLTVGPILFNANISAVAGLLTLSKTQKYLHFHRTALGIVVNVTTTDAEAANSHVDLCDIDCESYPDTGCACEHCPDGVPSVWAVNLAGFTDTQCDCADFNVGEILLYPVVGDNDFCVGCCVWENVVELNFGCELRVALVFDGTFHSLYLIHPAGCLTCGGNPTVNQEITTYRKAFDVGDCCDGMALDITVTTACDAPATLVVLPHIPLAGECLCPE